MQQCCSGVILCKDPGTHFSGKDNAFLTVGGTPAIDHLLAVFRPLFDDIVLVASDPTQFLSWDLHIVTDIFPYRNSLTGIHAGLFHAAHPHAFFAACDAPFLQAGVVHTLLDALESSNDVVIPETAVGLEPLCAIYSKRCLPFVEKLLDQQLADVPSIFPSVRVKKVGEPPLRSADPDLISFFRINSSRDVTCAERWLESGRKPMAATQGDRDV
jgi:molybdopterin-guanine dinucleotide biosynthesis protein A